MTKHIVKWTPFDLACRLRPLQQGTLNVGNTQQNRLNLLTLAVAQANAPSSPPWAKWNVLRASGTSPRSYLLINVPLVPGYVPPVGTND